MSLRLHSWLVVAMMALCPWAALAQSKSDTFLEMAEQFAVQGDSTWSMDKATSLSLLNAISYCDKSSLQAWACPTCPRNLYMRQLIEGVTVVDVRILVMDNAKDTTYVVFKGTDPLSWTEWVTDAKAWFTNVKEICDSCKVHTGFWKAHLIHRDAVVQALQASYNALPVAQESRKLIITGHSLGGATSSLFALYLKKFFGMDSTLYTYGAPRFGNKEFSQVFNSLYTSAYRFIHHRDLVPHLPPNVVGYYHVGLLIYCDDSKGVNCQARPGAEDDGGILHISPFDHAQYCGINYASYLDITPQTACKPV